MMISITVITEHLIHRATDVFYFK